MKKNFSGGEREKILASVYIIFPLQNYFSCFSVDQQSTAPYILHLSGLSPPLCRALILYALCTYLVHTLYCTHLCSSFSLTFPLFLPIFSSLKSLPKGSYYGTLYIPVKIFQTGLNTKLYTPLSIPELFLLRSLPLSPAFPRSCPFRFTLIFIP